jgi:hypothetical protein
MKAGRVGGRSIGRVLITTPLPYGATEPLLAVGHDIAP